MTSKGEQPPVLEPARSTPVLASADVVVTGRGPGGLAAAVGAARAGASVMFHLTGVDRATFLDDVAAAVSLRTNRSLGSVDVSAVQAELKLQAVRVF